MSADLDRMAAAQAKADAVIRQVADHDGSDSPRLLVAVTDPETNTRLATGFAAYQTTPRTPARRPVAATSPDRSASPPGPDGCGPRSTAYSPRASRSGTRSICAASSAKRKPGTGVIGRD